ncbi:hypothetical protein TpMuguga_04g00747 [Theileria parva strain Muguga]|uniref:Uncharacterized protein n=1 Tax=Theileria parva TaxID=5875 RepID=Q4N1J2_THEPA|nr:uncharacterized protein TpMuguga_04g00747 [Theileria parva strain Muguga]EAN32100.1 hypothetical protein TpMuguga_04g00747 [Theileria parva strain Muguga]|eukprot:XP_764383.1 hypothetical protein [Theileria parva strain Muguga]
MVGERVYKNNLSNSPSGGMNPLLDDESSSTLLCDWFDLNSDNLCYTKSANSRSQTNYSDPDTTPREYSTLSSTSPTIQTNTNDYNHELEDTQPYNQYDYGTVGLSGEFDVNANHFVHSLTDVNTYTGSIDGITSYEGVSTVNRYAGDGIRTPGTSAYNRLNSEIVETSTIISDGITEEPVETARNFFYTPTPPIDIHSESYNLMNNFFKTVTSKNVSESVEDWGIDRSIYTIYSRSGFFADCYNADKLNCKEYLSSWGMESFAECRIPLIFCIILTDKEVRRNEVQSSIVPLAINLLDRYMSRNKNSLNKLFKFVLDRVRFSSSDDSSLYLLTDIVNPLSYNTARSSVSNGDSLNNSSRTSLESEEVSSQDQSHFLMDSFHFYTIDCSNSFDNSANRRDYNFNHMDSNVNDIFNNNATNNANNDLDDINNSIDSVRINSEIVYNLISAACYFIADRYNGLANVSVRVLLMQWVSISKLFTRTRCASFYIARNKNVSLSVIMSIMFDILRTLDYVITTPFVSYMTQALIIASFDLPYPQNPSQLNIYQKTASILARVALIDDTFHRFAASIITLSIYALVRKLATHDKVIADDSMTWLIVDQSNPEISNCMNLLTSTLSQFVNTELLDVLAQPVKVKNKNEEFFTCILQSDSRNISLDTIKWISNLLSN